MKKIYLGLAALLGLALTSCTDNHIYGEEPITEGNVMVVPCGNGITIVTEDETKDEWGNCKSSPYTKFYEEWNEKEGWTDGMERVYDAWITLQYEYFVTTIRCDNAEKHQYSVVTHQIAERETLMKYFNHEKGYGGAKGMIFDTNDAMN